MSKHYPTNSDDIIDSRDVIARLDDLEAQLQSQYDSEAETDPAWPAGLTFADWIARIAERDAHEYQSEAIEYRALRALADECEGYAADWKHGEALIRDSYFETYARDLADDLGRTTAKAEWPYTCIDWERAAEELQMDYTSAEFDGVTYWIRM